MTYLSAIAAAIRDELPADLVPAEDTEELMLLYALLATAVGIGVTSQHVHDAWVAWMTIRGQHHESMVPYDSLSADVQREDEPFADAIRRVAMRVHSS